jgi:hypothetical protein
MQQIHSNLVIELLTYPKIAIEHADNAKKQIKAYKEPTKIDPHP